MGETDSTNSWNTKMGVQEKPDQRESVETKFSKFGYKDWLKVFSIMEGILIFLLFLMVW